MKNNTTYQAGTIPLYGRGQGEAVVIIKYNAGNIESVNNALMRLGVKAEITADPQKIRAADKVIFPGVGEASTTMAYLKEHKLDVLIRSLKQPVLGICLGQQLMCAHSEEGDVECLGIFDEKVKRFQPAPGQEFVTKVPHMGWNNIYKLNSDILTPDLENQFVYFVHSYYVEVGEHTAATCDYINPFSAALHKDNFYATQFHPEKSQKVGARILENFLKI
ncbi:MAG: imidazole glycerol phosphate synthase subunit HisH [Prolixibacteraceae bacterium]|nr:imidazole glycerol phosphate synthase subunit HisH [Prolixibacteraceae bacterium]